MDAENWITWAESNFTTCDDCIKIASEKAEIEKAAEVVEMHYAEYKKHYTECKTVSDSYNSETKTIKVIVSKRKKAKMEILETYPDIYPDDDEEEKAVYEIIKKYK